MDTQDVTVRVPIDRLGEFYEWFGRWFQQGGVNAAGGDDTAEPVPFHEATPAQVATWYGKLKPPAKRIFSALAAQPGTRFSGVELAEAAQIAKGPAAVAGTLSWPGKHAYRMGLGFPLEWERDEQKYWMSPLVAKLIADAGDWITDAKNFKAVDAENWIADAENCKAPKQRRK